MRSAWLPFVSFLFWACSHGSGDARSPLSPVIGSGPGTSPGVSPAPAGEPARDLGLYHASYGEGAPTVVYLHGGPGHNSALFEATAAEALSKHYRVIVYDRRGAGRSEPTEDSSAFTFDNAITDLDRILEGVEAPVLLGHSFGGVLATAYLRAHPDFDGKVVLINAPIVFQRTLSTIIANCRKVYEAAGDQPRLEALERLEALDAASVPYLGETFRHGMGCGLYVPSQPTAEAMAIYRALGESPLGKWVANSQPLPMFGFIENEHYNTLDLSRSVELHNAKISAIYSDEDRIISPEDRAFLASALGDRYIEIEGAAHNVFVDRQSEFIDALDVLSRRGDE